MKNTKMKFAVLTALTVLSAQASATGLVAIPETGFDNSAYTACNPTNLEPTPTSNNTCAVFPVSEFFSPVVGYSMIANTIRFIPPTTGGSGYIGYVYDRIWRNAAQDMCIFGVIARFLNADHDSNVAGTQSFVMSDLARGGFSGFADINAGYYQVVSLGFPVHRIGRTFTSVQASGLPGFGSSAAIHPSVADVNDNWVDFTMKAYYAISNSSPLSQLTYVQAPCDATYPHTWVKSGAIRLRSVIAQKEIAIPGYAPPGAIIP